MSLFEQQLRDEVPRSLKVLREAENACHRCSLYKFATQAVSGEGPAHAPLMLIGEQPGNDEDLEGHPFVGPAGRVLDKANMKGVPGATVKVVGSAATTTTDTAGRFTLTGSSGLSGRFSPHAAEPYFQSGALFVEAAASGQTAKQSSAQFVGIFIHAGGHVGILDLQSDACWREIDEEDADGRLHFPRDLFDRIGDGAPCE
jgi:hypothetical protein